MSSFRVFLVISSLLILTLECETTAVNIHKKELEFLCYFSQSFVEFVKTFESTIVILTRETMEIFWSPINSTSRLYNEGPT